jgi:hypothetical protein
LRFIRRKESEPTVKQSLLFVSLLVMGCDAGIVDPGAPVEPAALVALDAFRVPIGVVQTLASFTAIAGTQMHFLVLDSNVQPLALGLAWEGEPDDLHRDISWPDIAAYSPFLGETPRPMLAGPYRVDVGCSAEATRDCLFALKAWLVLP